VRRLRAKRRHVLDASRAGRRDGYHHGEPEPANHRRCPCRAHATCDIPLAQRASSLSRHSSTSRRGKLRRSSIASRPAAQRATHGCKHPDHVCPSHRSHIRSRPRSPKRTTPPEPTTVPGRIPARRNSRQLDRSYGRPANRAALVSFGGLLHVCVRAASGTRHACLMRYTVRVHREEHPREWCTSPLGLGLPGRGRCLCDECPLGVVRAARLLVGRGGRSPRAAGIRIRAAASSVSTRCGSIPRASAPVLVEGQPIAQLSSPHSHPQPNRASSASFRWRGSLCRVACVH
jgi:hypothetical protein